MKSKIACKRIALLGCVLFALAIFVPAVVKAVPVTLSLDNPNQTVAVPPSGTTMVDFAGTLIIAPGFHFEGEFPSSLVIDFPFNAAGSHSLTVTGNSAFLAFLLGPPFGTGTYTGSMFEVSVPTGTPVGLYAYHLFPDLAEIFVRVRNDEGPLEEFVARANFSVLVTGVGVPDRGSSILLLGLSLAALWSFHGLKRFSRRDC